MQKLFDEEAKRVAEMQDRVRAAATERDEALAKAEAQFEETRKKLSDEEAEAQAQFGKALEEARAAEREATAKAVEASMAGATPEKEKK